MTGFPYPRFRLNLLAPMPGYAALGAVVAGYYGVVHERSRPTANTMLY